VWFLAIALYLLLVAISPTLGILALPYLFPVVVTLIVLQLCLDYRA
jgi:hypothetical protein